MKKEHLLFSIAASAAFLIEAMAWPLSSGRDGYSYLYYALDFFNLKPEDHFTMLFRTPVAPFFDFALLSLFPWASEVMMGALFIAVVLILFEIGRFWNRATSLLLPSLFLLHFAWGSLFHVVSNDPPIAILIPILLWLCLKSSTEKTAFLFFIAGIATAILTLTRPGVFPALGLFTLFLRAPKKARFTFFTLFYLGCLPLLGGWSYWNLKKHGFFALAPGTDVILPLGRVLAQEKILFEENGPNSRLLANAVRENLILSSDKAISANQYFSEHAGYFEYLHLADRVWGPGNYSVLKAAGWEAVRAYPVKYFTGVTKTALLTVAGNLKLPVPLRSGARVHTHKGHISYSEKNRDQWVPIKNFDFSINRHDEETRRHLASIGPNYLAAWDQMEKLPLRDGWVWLGSMLNWLAYLFPPMLLWILLAPFWFCKKAPTPETDKVLLIFWLLCLATNMLASLSIWSVVYEYRLPFDPVYVLPGLLALRVVWIKLKSAQKV